ncbi:MAG: hypothetical protein JWM86_1856, partial [Thermoleophilia bacterium]|nr:hypothetical protein [Thermoleophilia bacterium]
VPATTLRYALNRNVTLAGDKVQVTGELRVAGAPSNGKTVRLQRKTGGCDAPTGSYVDASQAVTGNNVDDGLVNFPAKVVQNTCFRLAWVTDSAIKYSAPIAVKVSPVTSIKLDRKLMKRGTKFCTTIKTNVAVNGRMRVQYRKGSGAWSTATTASLVRSKSKKVCVALAKAGIYKVRIVADNLKHSTGWQQYETVTKDAGTIRINDVWRRASR